MKLNLFTIIFIVTISFVAYFVGTSARKEMSQQRQYVSEVQAQRTLLQLMINQEDYFCREGHWNTNLLSMYPEDDLDTTYYRYSMDTLHFVILAERRDYEQGSQIPQYIAVGRSGRFLKDPRPYVQ